MKFNYALEKKKFEEQWKKLRKEYAAAGMPAEDIEKMYEFDWEVLKRERIYSLHNQEIPTSLLDDGEERDPLAYRYLEQISIPAKETDPQRRYGWVDEISRDELCKVLKTLCEEDMELITLLVFDEYSQLEIAEIRGVTHQAICKQIGALKKKFEKK
ncbi:MAG: sigma-70 family RNA polymerase sigma factor [Clostridia bacterium]|nr:sigma-70 family RNA polymerase sigma factor [Clostridia bacterium]